MDRNSVIGFILIALILFGFTFYESSQARKRAEQQRQLDSIALAQMPVDTLAVQEENGVMIPAPGFEQSPGTEGAIYSDSLLQAAHAKTVGEIVVLENNLLRLELNSKGAQPYSAQLKKYSSYGGGELFLFRGGDAEYSISIYAGQYIRTSDFFFDVTESTDSTAVFRLGFANGGYIEQRYALARDSYSVDNELSFVGMDGIIPRNVGNYDIDFNVVIPRLEKGYKGESQYSKLDYYFSGEKKPAEMGRGRSNSKSIGSRLSWVAFQQQFFSAIMRAPQEFSNGELAISFFPEADESHNLMACSAKMRSDFHPAPEVRVPYEFYFGPNHFNTLKSYGHKYEKIIPLGGWLVGWFTRYAIIPMFNFFSRFISNFGLIILLMTLVIKLVVFPLTSKSYMSSAKMQALRPEIEKINAKYPKQEDAMKKQQATMDLYKRAGVNTMGGCLPTLLTFPILWAMFRFFPASIELRQQPFLWCDDLSAYDSILDYGTRIPILGDHLSLFALLMAIVMWVYSKMTMANQAASNDPTASSMKFMTLWMMPIMMFFICNNLSAALSYYYLLSQLIAIIQTWIIKKWFVHPEQVLAKLKASEGKPLPKSKWQLRLEEAQKMQEQQRRMQNNRR
ncbi:MAG: membrane protein insertase YidC [Bacteroidales bacterium]|nr:membrane protein insertase YidC [Bacteroidales bacterium]